MLTDSGSRDLPPTRGIASITIRTLLGGSGKWLAPFGGLWRTLLILTTIWIVFWSYQWAAFRPEALVPETISRARVQQRADGRSMNEIDAELRRQEQAIAARNATIREYNTAVESRNKDAQDRFLQLVLLWPAAFLVGAWSLFKAISESNAPH